MQNIKLSGGFSSTDTMSKYAGMIGEVYGGGEYAVPESDLLSISGGTSHTILISGGMLPNRAPIHDPHSASTVEIELRDLFQFPRKVRLNKKKIPAKRRTKKRGGYTVSTYNPIMGGGTTDAMKFRDVESIQLKTLLGGVDVIEDTKDSILSSTDVTDDYAIASEIDKLSISGSSSNSSSSESSESSESEKKASSESDDSIDHTNIDRSTDSHTPTPTPTVNSTDISIDTSTTPSLDDGIMKIDIAFEDDRDQKSDLNIFDAIAN